MQSAYENQQYHDWFNANIYNLAKEYASRNPIIGMEREDYVQELVMRVWQALPKYNPKKAKLSTFAFLWFSSKRYQLTDILRRRQKALGQVESLEDQITDSGCTVEGTIACEDPDYAMRMDAQYAYSLVGKESKLFYSGYTIQQVASMLKEPMAVVQEAIGADLERVRKALGVESV